MSLKGAYVPIPWSLLRDRKSFIGLRQGAGSGNGPILSYTNPN